MRSMWLIGLLASSLTAADALDLVTVDTLEEQYGQPGTAEVRARWFRAGHKAVMRNRVEILTQMRKTIEAFDVVFEQGESWRTFVGQFDVRLNVMSWLTIHRRALSGRPRAEMWLALTPFVVKWYREARVEVGQPRVVPPLPPVPDAIVQWLKENHHKLHKTNSRWYDQLNKIDDPATRTAGEKWLREFKMVRNKEQELAAVPTLADLNQRAGEMMRFCWLELPADAGHDVMRSCVEVLVATSIWDERCQARLAELEGADLDTDFISGIRELVGTDSP